MKVIRQDDNGIDRKGALLPSDAKRGAKGADMIDKPRRPTFRECYREEVGSALNAVASISDHSGMISRIPLRSSGLRAVFGTGFTPCGTAWLPRVPRRPPPRRRARA